MNLDYAMTKMGIAVAAVGITMVAWHVRKQRLRGDQTDSNPEEARFLDNQYRRRMQTSALIVTLGGLLSLCDYLDVFRTSPVFASLYVIGLLFLSLWLILLAFSDAMASRLHVGRTVRRHDQTRESLERALKEARARAGN